MIEYLQIFPAPDDEYRAVHNEAVREVDARVFREGRTRWNAGDWRVFATMMAEAGRIRFGQPEN